ncbi:MAG: ATP-binding protein [Pyrinomonadaceae bacterium]
MAQNLANQNLTGLIQELCKLPDETEWVEFKLNDCEPTEIGEYISAIANSTALFGKTNGYVVWGVQDETHEISGTTFKPTKTKIGNEELENWLLRKLEPKINFRFHQFEVESQNVVLLEIGRAFRHPVRFDGQEHIRIGTYKKKLKDFPEKERELWRVFDQTPFEDLTADENLSTQDVLHLLDCNAYFEFFGLPLPTTANDILDSIAKDELIKRMDNGQWSITNLGALLFARKVTDFRSIRRKSTRVIEYNGTTRIEAKREQLGVKGYAIGFEGLISYVNTLLPTNEVIEAAIRRTTPMYPEVAVREIVANALIHQDLGITGAGPMIEIFDDRLEVSNPGAPLVSADRLLNSPPRSRNEAIASFMRRIGFCEERGVGVDKVVFETEFHQLPAPIFEQADDNMRVVLFAPKSARRMEKADRVRACYWHACLKYVNRDFLTNGSIRDRFGMSKGYNSIASRYIREAVDEEMIKPFDETAPPKMRKYVPFWVDLG